MEFVNPGAHACRFDDLYRWSVNEPGDFWQAVWDFTEIVSTAKASTALLDGERFPGAQWFPGARLNFAENLLRFRDDRVALVSVLENGQRRQFTYAELYREVSKLATALRGIGVVQGDRVAGYLPNIPETVIAMLATASIGAIWSSCSPDFGVSGVIDRFGQIEPKVLFGADGYCYNGRVCECMDKLASIAQRIGSIEKVVIVPVIAASPRTDRVSNAVDWNRFLCVADQPLVFEPLRFDHPVYILYSSGTTGKPKCIVHGAGGTLIQHLKEHQLHVDLHRDDVLFYFTTCGWMMWNWLVSGLATGSTLVLFDGSPFAADGDALLKLVDAEGISIFGISAKYVSALEKAGKKPRLDHDLSSLKTVLSTGSPLSARGFEYVYRWFSEDICLSSISGGTDIVSCFVLGTPVLPVYAGEIQTAGLGMAVEIWNDAGVPVTGEKGELVCTRPFPSAPVAFWKDPDGSRYRDAYFRRWPGIWAHGDYGEVTPHGGFVIHGRSDAVLNPGGVRIGTAEIYRQVEALDEIQESVVIGQQWQGDVRVVLFVVLKPGEVFDEELEEKIRSTIRSNTTPRHVPAKILAVDDIPRTISGKISELAVRNVVHDLPVTNTDALANPEALDFYRNLPELMEQDDEDRS